ncbi:MAG: TldD/PmbA family protein [Candidatus Izemoplasmataceae bacterium]
MLRFPEHLYTDVRIENVYETKIHYKKTTLQEENSRTTEGVFIRVYDGSRWYYSAITDASAIQSEIDKLASMATPNPAIDKDPIVKAFEVNKDDKHRFDQCSLRNIPIKKKRKLIKSLLNLYEDDSIVHHESQYVDRHTKKTFYSSKGADLHFDVQFCGVRSDLEMAHGDNREHFSTSKAGVRFEDLNTIADHIKNEVDKNIAFIKACEPVEGGDYPVLLSPEAAGVFTHESFGHKSEADFMVGDATMKKAWALGKTIAPDGLSIVDSGEIDGSGFTPYDDEGSKARKTYLIKKGKLAGRLHSAATATELGEMPTGNARAVDFEFEPIVRMTTTYIEKGDKPLDAIIQSIDHGIYIDKIKHGSGMSTFTIAPSRAYKIENGEITTPLQISVISGSVFKTLEKVEALSQEFELLSFVGGGCGKMEQFPLPVGFGGPYTLVSSLKVE